MGDLRRAVHERRGGLAHDVAESLLYSRHAVRPVWSASDPRPAVQAGLRLLGRRFARR